MSKLTTRGTARLIEIAKKYHEFITNQIHWLTDVSRRRGPDGINDEFQNSTLKQRGKLGEYNRLLNKFEQHMTALRAEAKRLSITSEEEQKDDLSAPASPMSLAGATFVSPGKISTDLANSKPKIEIDESEDQDMKLALKFLPTQEELMRQAARLFYFNRYQSPWHAQSWKIYSAWGTVKGSEPGHFSQANTVDKISLMLKQIFLSTISDSYGRATSYAVVDSKMTKTARASAFTRNSRKSMQEDAEQKVADEKPSEPQPGQQNEEIHFIPVADFNVLKSITYDQKITTDKNSQLISKTIDEDPEAITKARLTQGTQAMLNISKFFIDNIAKQKQLLITKKNTSWWIGAWNIDTQPKQPTIHGKLALYEQLEKLFRCFDNNVFHQTKMSRELEDKHFIELQELIRLASLVYSMRRLATEAQSWKDYKTWGSDIGPFSKDHTDPVSVKLRQTYLQTLSDREGRAIRMFDKEAKANVTVDNDTLLRRLMSDDYVEGKKKSINPTPQSR